MGDQWKDFRRQVILFMPNDLPVASNKNRFRKFAPHMSVHRRSEQCNSFVSDLSRGTDQKNQNFDDVGGQNECKSYVIGFVHSKAIQEIFRLRNQSLKKFVDDETVRNETLDISLNVCVLS